MKAVVNREEDSGRKLTNYSKFVIVLYTECNILIKFKFTKWIYLPSQELNFLQFFLSSSRGDDGEEDDSEEDNAGAPGTRYQLLVHGHDG